MMQEGLDDGPDFLSEEDRGPRAVNVDLQTDATLQVDISDALSGETRSSSPSTPSAKRSSRWFDNEEVHHGAHFRLRRKEMKTAPEGYCRKGLDSRQLPLQEDRECSLITCLCSPVMVAWVLFGSAKAASPLGGDWGTRPHRGSVFGGCFPVRSVAGAWSPRPQTQTLVLEKLQKLGEERIHDQEVPDIFKEGHALRVFLTSLHQPLILISVSFHVFWTWAEACFEQEAFLLEYHSKVKGPRPESDPNDHAHAVFYRVWGDILNFRKLKLRVAADETMRNWPTSSKYYLKCLELQKMLTVLMLTAGLPCRRRALVVQEAPATGSGQARAKKQGIHLPGETSSASQKFEKITEALVQLYVSLAAGLSSDLRLMNFKAGAVVAAFRKNLRWAGRLELKPLKCRQDCQSQDQEARNLQLHTAGGCAGVLKVTLNSTQLHPTKPFLCLLPSPPNTHTRYSWSVQMITTREPGPERENRG
ncbi:sorting nexin-6-like protein [Lates japonicus]|uniref:Sorting nexin-6-like protein n=1 Tax=Lates japonicus TaxID=270547 RepID=A0AAD3N983_LATJO|nr:sorting nexin-6-like protein [Lates japonicus]